ncbi:MAG TPA: hypothetical protein VM778_07255 [Gemmatimonadota bacterium]|nr:hypothetical protein [Gemmatimonadota bacterium]
MKQVLIVIILVLVPAAARAQRTMIGDPHFTFTTSVVVQNLHQDVEAAAMDCEVRDTTSPGAVIGQTLQTFSLDGTGSYSGTVVVAVRADEGKDPADGNLYACNIVLRKKGTTEWVNPSRQGETWQKPSDAQFYSGGQGAIP